MPHQCFPTPPQIFQFIIAYACIQAFETNLMYTYAINVGNYQVILCDFKYVNIFATFFDQKSSQGHLVCSCLELQYLVQDLFFTTLLAALMGYTEPR